MTALARERWLFVCFGTWLLQDAKLGPEETRTSLDAVQAWHHRLFGVYLTETSTEANAGKGRAPPPPPPLPPPLSRRDDGAARKPRYGIEPRFLAEGMVLLLGQKDTNAAEVANKRACVAASFVGMLRGSEAALREEVASFLALPTSPLPPTPPTTTTTITITTTTLCAITHARTRCGTYPPPTPHPHLHPHPEQVAWDPAVHLTRADLYFEGHGDNARAVIMTRAVRLGASSRGVPERSPAEYQAPRLGGTMYRSWAKVLSAAARCPCGRPATHRSRSPAACFGLPSGPERRAVAACMWVPKKGLRWRSGAHPALPAPCLLTL